MNRILTLVAMVLLLGTSLALAANAPGKPLQDTTDDDGELKELAECICEAIPCLPEDLQKTYTKMKKEKKLFVASWDQFIDAEVAKRVEKAGKDKGWSAAMKAAIAKSLRPIVEGPLKAKQPAAQAWADCVLFMYFEDYSNDFWKKGVLYEEYVHVGQLNSKGVVGLTEAPSGGNASTDTALGELLYLYREIKAKKDAFDYQKKLTEKAKAAAAADPEDVDKAAASSQAGEGLAKLLAIMKSDVELFCDALESTKAVTGEAKEFRDKVKGCKAQGHKAFNEGNNWLNSNYADRKNKLENLEEDE